MAVTIKFTRSDNRTFSFDDSPLGVTQLEGVGGPVLELFTEKNATGDGDLVVGNRIGARTITIGATNRFYRMNEQMRKLASAFFNPLYTFNVEITYGTMVRTANECMLKALAMPTDNIHKPLKIQMTLLSPSGYLDGGGLYGKDIASVQPRLGWPWVSVAGVGHLYSLYNFARVISVNNDGDAPTYIRAVFTATGSDGVVNPTLVKDEYRIRILTTLQLGDELEIDTEKKLVKINGVNALHLVDKTSNWSGMRMDIGNNVFGFEADEHDNQLSVRIYYTKRFYGLGG